MKNIINLISLCKIGLNILGIFLLVSFLSAQPTGTGVSARAAIHYARGEIGVGESITIESIIGSTFSVKVDRLTSFGQYEAVIPEVSGNAFIMGKNTFWINPDDPLKDGFILR